MEYDNLDQLTERDKVKYDLISHLDKSDFSSFELQNSIYVSIMGVDVELQVFGQRREFVSEAVKFLNKRYQNYLRPPDGSQCRVRFYVMSDELGELGHPIWNNPEPVGWFLPADDGLFYHVQRDFGAIVDDHIEQIDLVCPRIREGCPDAVDNIMSVVLAKWLEGQEALTLHAATVIREGHAYVFFGESGAGKTTLAEQCWALDGLPVVSGDQVFLKIAHGRLWAHPAPTTIPEFPAGHMGLHSEPAPVAGLFHLVQKGSFCWKTLSPIEILAPLLMQAIPYKMQFLDESQLLKLCQKAVTRPQLIRGELSYPKGVSFWSFLEDNVK